MSAEPSLPSPRACTAWGFPIANETAEESLRDSAQSGDDFSQLNIEDVVSETATRLRDNDSDGQMFSLDDAAYSQRTVPSMIARTERLRIDDHATESSERAVYKGQTKPTDTQVEPIPALASCEDRILAKPTFVGLPEELVLEIVSHLDLFGIMTLRMTNRRLSFITRARVIWILHLSSLLDQVNLPKNAATFPDALLSTSALEHVVKRPHAFLHKWFRSRSHRQNPSSSKVLSVAWGVRKAVSLPILLPGGRWLIAVCDNLRPLHAGVCLWDLDHGNGSPEAQMEIHGAILFIDAKMDRTGTFAFMTVLSHKLNAAISHVYSVEIYQIRFLPDSFGFFHIDSLSLNDRRAFEVQIYPEYGHVVIDLFDRVLIWAYSPINKCAWVVTSKHRHQYRRFSHRSAHAIACTYNLLLVADGDESSLRAYIRPPLLNRPPQLSSLVLYIIPPYFEHPLPHFAMSLRFSANRLVDIPGAIEAQASTHRQPAVNGNVSPNGPAMTLTHDTLNDAVINELNMSLPCFDPFARGSLFVDAAACGSYLFCSYPLYNTLEDADSSQALIWTTMNRADMHEQTRRRQNDSRPCTDATSMARPFDISPAPMFARIISGPRCTGDALWIGDIDMINPSLFVSQAEPGAGARTAVLMRSSSSPGELVILSAPKPPRTDSVDFSAGHTVIDEVEQGEARTVLGRLEGSEKGKQTSMPVRIEEASVDSISGRVCIVETMSQPSDAPGFASDPVCVLRLLEYP